MNDKTKDAQAEEKAPKRRRRKPEAPKEPKAEIVLEPKVAEKVEELPQKPEAPKAPAEPKTVKVRAIPKGGFRRLGRHFGADWTEINVADLEPDDLARILAEPALEAILE